MYLVSKIESIRRYRKKFSSRSSVDSGEHAADVEYSRVLLFNAHAVDCDSAVHLHGFSPQGVFHFLPRAFPEFPTQIIRFIFKSAVSSCSKQWYPSSRSLSGYLECCKPAP
jgi:hypothetical protein